MSEETRTGLTARETAQKWIDTWLTIPGVVPCNTTAREDDLTELLAAAPAQDRLAALLEALRELRDEWRIKQNNVFDTLTIEDCADALDALCQREP